jgi:hypothetical protein
MISRGCSGTGVGSIESITTYKYNFFKFKDDITILRFLVPFGLNLCVLIVEAGNVYDNKLK